MVVVGEGGERRWDVVLRAAGGRSLCEEVVVRGDGEMWW